MEQIDDKGKITYDYPLFAMMTCRCSRRTMKEEEEYGSYCDSCWAIIKDNQHCCMCSIEVEKGRLYVSALDNSVKCFHCFRKLPDSALESRYMKQLEYILINIIKALATRYDATPPPAEATSLHRVFRRRRVHNTEPVHAQPDEPPHQVVVDHLGACGDIHISK